MTKKKTTRTHKKQEPNYIHDMIKIEKPFTKDNTAKENTALIVSKYKLRGELIEICEKFNEAYKLYCLINHADDETPSTKKQKAYIKVIESTAERMEALISNMGLEIGLKLIRAIPEDPDKNVFGELKDRLHKDLKELKNRAFFANYETPKDKGGRPSYDALKTLIWKLANIYEEYTTDVPIIKPIKNGETSVVKGKFFDLLNDFIEISKVPFTEDELKSKASTIRNVLKQREDYKKQVE